MAYTIYQGKLLNHDSHNPRIWSVLQYPDHYVMTNVRLPHLLQSQGIPQKGSIVLIASEGPYKAYVIAVLRDPLEFVSTNADLMGADPKSTAQAQPGEIFLESRGDPTANFPGFGSTLHLANDGTINLWDGKRKECLLIGGSDDDDDGEVILRGDKGFFESNVTPVTNVQSAFRFDDTNTLQVVNNVVTLPSTGVPIEVTTAELKIDTLGHIQLRNTTLGTTKDLLDFDVTGKLTLKNQFGTYEISASGGITEQATLSLSLSAGSTMSLSSTGNMTLTGSTINLNSGTFGIARLNDLTISNTSTDPIFWLMPPALSVFMTAIAAMVGGGGNPVTMSALGALGATFVATVPIAPVSITGKISTSSTTVKAGG